MTRLLVEIQNSIDRCHSEIKAPVDDSILGVLDLMCDWMARIEESLGATDAKETL
jgi:hypothetical protein